MKNLIQLICVLFIVSATITSCSIEKRHFLPGYHFEWKTKEITSTQEIKIQEPSTKKQRRSYDENYSAETEPNFATGINKNHSASSQQETKKHQNIYSKEEHKNQSEGIKFKPKQRYKITKKRTYRRLKVLKPYNTLSEDPLMLALAITCIILGFPFFGVACMLGFSSEFWINLALYCAAAVLLFLALAAFALNSAFAGGFSFGLFLALGIILILASVIHAVFVVVSNS